MTEQKTLKLYTFSNNPDSPYLSQMLTMFYSAAVTNKVGIMQALNTVTGKEELILVGIELEEDGTPSCYPIAKCLPSEEVDNYIAPDGEGGWKHPEGVEVH